MKKKLIPALFLLLTPSCVFVISETHSHEDDEGEHKVETERDQDNG